jgi:large subunit ribosomal protein L19
MADLVRSVETQQLKTDLPDFGPGDTVRINLRVIEGNKERLQAFEGVVIRKRGSGTGATFTVRRISHGIGVERTFLLNSPRLEKIERTRQGRVRRARLYFLRGLSGRAARIKEKR